MSMGLVVMLIFKQTATQDYADAQYRLAMLHLEGLHVEQDSEKALTFFSQAAAQDHAAASYELGQMYLQGRGDSKRKIILIRPVIWVRKEPVTPYNQRRLLNSLAASGEVII